MKCKGNFVFKTFSYRPAGTLTGEDGKEVKYAGAYKLKVDDLGDDGSINERVFTVKEDSVELINDLKQFSAYDRVLLTFDVVLYTSRVSLVLVGADLEDDIVGDNGNNY